VDGLGLFDAYAGVGPSSQRASPLAPEDVDGLLGALDDHGIEEALVYSQVARDHVPAEGNARLLADIAGQTRLHPQWVLVPHQAGDMPPPRELVAYMLASGVRAARLYPARSSHNFSLQAWCAGPMLRELQERRLPVFVDGDQVSWDEVHTLLGDYPALPLVLTRCSYRSDRYLYALWEAHQNLYVETSAYVVHAALENVARRFGPQRLLFGSGLPEMAPGAAITFLMRSNLPDEWRRQIGGGNLRRLLAGVQQ
jgi:hypothetical protein